MRTSPASADRPVIASPEEPPLIREARTKAASGLLAEAFAALGALKGGPDAPLAHKAMGDILADRRADHDAAKEYRQAIRLNAGLAEAHNNLANVLWRGSRDPAALDHYVRALDLRPGYGTARANLALVKAEVGAVDEAIALIEEIPANQRNAVAWRALALVQRQAGRLDAALAAAERATALADGNSDSLATTSAILRGLGRAEEALAMARRAIDADPMNPSGYIETATCLRASGQPGQALTSARQAVEVGPTDARAYDALARELLAQGKSEEARIYLEHAVKLDPNFLTATFDLGVLFEEEGLSEEAEKHYRQVLAKQETHDPAAINLAGVLINLRRPGEAEVILRRVLAREPGNGHAWSALSRALAEMSRHDEAAEAAEKGAALAPDIPETHVNLGVARHVLGDLAGAQSAFRKALDLNPEFVPAMFSLAVTDPKAGADLVDQVEPLLDRKSLSDDQRCQLHFSLAILHDARGDHGKAFESARKGHALDIDKARYRLKEQEDLADAMTAVFDAEFFAGRAAFGSTSNKPIFIVGLPRSGTTLIEQVLASHSQVFGGGELTKIPVLAHSISEFAHTTARFPESALALDEPSTLRIANAYLRTLRERAKAAPRVTDKMPSNFFYLGLIALLFPHARIINCARDPLDAFISGYLVRFRQPIPHTWSQSDFAHFHGLYARLMTHWNDMLPGRILTVRYEDFVADQVAETRRLLDHCGLGFEAGCLDFHETVRPLTTASSTQVRRPLFANSIGRAKGYLPYLDELSAKLGRRGMDAGV